jgi:hypothetical protein
MYPLTTNVIEKEPIDTVIEKEHNDNNDTGKMVPFNFSITII